MNDDTKERIETLTKALQVCVGEGAQRLIDRILFLETSDMSKVEKANLKPPPGAVVYLDQFKELQDKLKETERKLSVAQSEMMGYDDNLAILNALKDKLIKAEQQRDKFSNAIWFLISELKDNEHCNSGCSKILKNWDDYRKKYGI